MKHLLKKMMYAVAPQWTTAFMSARARAHAHRVVKTWGCDRLNRALIAKFGNTVQDGPFAGMILSPMTHAEHLGPYLLGVYESELDPAWESVLAGNYSQIIDIGAKFGYYAIGLARRYPNATVIAFDTDWWARQAIQEMINVNGVKNVVFNGFCTPTWLRNNVSEGTLIISDCEGFEANLFEGDAPATLKGATLIIETHDCFVPGISERLREAFRVTHTVRVFGDSTTRRIRTEGMDFLSAHDQNLANMEVRPVQTWLLCLPKDLTPSTHAN